MNTNDYKYNDTFISKTKKSITNEMRDCVWSLFKQAREKDGSLNRNAVAKDIADKSGMSRGSAFIYIGILINLLDGVANKRNLKIEDLSQYVKYIKEECSEKEFENTLKSLELSIPYWKGSLIGNFAYEVERLIKQYRE